MEIPDHIREAQLARQAERQQKVELLKQERLAREAQKEQERLQQEEAERQRKAEEEQLAKQKRLDELANKPYMKNSKTMQAVAASTGASTSSAPAARAAPAPTSTPDKQAAEPAKRGLTDPSAAAIEARRIEEERKARRARQAEERRLMEEERRLHGDDKNWKIRKMVVASMEDKPPRAPSEAYNSSSMSDRILVCVRTRPLLKKEADAKDFKILSFRGDKQLTLHDVKKNVDLSLRLDNYDYNFDFVFDDNIDNEVVYSKTLMPMIDSIFTANKKISMFAYGQTGSGKTFTMMSIFQQSIDDMFVGLDSPKLYGSLGLSIGISFYEVYQGKVFDLFNDRKQLDVLEDNQGNINLRGLTEPLVRSPEDVLKMLAKGQKYRVSRATEMNDTSSRSHAIMQVVLRTSSGDEHGRLSLIDLAGSEKGSDTPSSDKQTRNEAAEINKSLLTLKECIRALDEGSYHTPFRGSKLTMILRDCLIGESSRAIMVACLAPGYSASEATLNTLRYAERLKTVSEDLPLVDDTPTEETLRLQELEALRNAQKAEAEAAAAAHKAVTSPAKQVASSLPSRPSPTQIRPSRTITPTKPLAAKAAPASTGAVSTAAHKPAPASPAPAAVAVAASPARASGPPPTNLKDWFISIGIPEDSAMEYVAKLEGEGFDDLDSLNDITEEELSDMGMKVGHRRKVLRCFQELKG